ncbi:hypothetical protein KKG45_11655 [bacterium]|nr:hypothetical protein [bacterium]MBU1073891.1 hypothetical protein [bacterium]MBU1676650.1 hypothetical protein [bacterium]
MSEPARKGIERRSCSPGCLIAMIVVVVGFAVAGYFVMRPINAAKRIEQDLVDRLDPVPAYIPAPDGAVAPERVEIFLAVRAGLLEQTGRIQATFARIDSVDRQEDLDAGELWDFLRDAVGTLPRMVEYFSARNTALLAHGMGLGEYFYIYVLAYGDRLCPPGEDGHPPAECEYVTGRTTRELTQMLRNQLDNPDHPPPDGIAASLEREIAALERGERVLPWQGERPAAIAASLAPYRARLDRLFCEQTRELELIQKNRNIGGIGD